MTREITLPGRRGAVRGVALVDDEDYERVAPHRWYLSANGYARGMIEGRWVLLHRHVLGLGSARRGDPVVDHINHNPLDNRRENLRLVSRAANAQNVHGAHRDSVTSTHRGVSLWRGKSGQTWWRARVSVKGREISAGYFNTEEEAAAAAAAVRLQHMPFSQGDRTPLGLEPVR